MNVSGSDLVKAKRSRPVIFVYTSFALLFPLVMVFPATWPPLVVPWIVGLFAALIRPNVLVHLSFLKIRLLRRIGLVLQYIFFLPTFLFLGIALLASIGRVPFQVSPEVEPFLGFILLAVVEGFFVGVILGTYTDVFDPRTLARLCFRQAKEIQHGPEKLVMVMEAFKHLREDAADFGLEFDSSRFERLFAIRLFDGQDLSKDLDQVSGHLSDGDLVLAAVNELGAGASDFLTTRKTRTQRWGAHLETFAKYAALILPILAAVLSLATRSS